MASRFDFFWEGLRTLRSTGSVTRSSRFLCRAIADKIDPVQAHVLVELGPGDGVITAYLLSRLAPDGRLFIFEINDVFVQKLRSIFADEPRVVLIHDSADNLAEHLRQHGVQQVDYVVSGIPFVVLPEALTESIVTKCRQCLRVGGQFIQFHYSPLLVPLYKRIFGNASTDFVPLNLPPAIIIVCDKSTEA
jgi:phospholipid N-methyltransferase